MLQLVMPGEETVERAVSADVAGYADDIADTGDGDHSDGDGDLSY